MTHSNPKRNMVPKVVLMRPKVALNAVKGNQVNVVKASACWVWKPKTKVIDHGNPQMDLQDKGVIDSRCSRHMTGNMSCLTDFEEIDGGYVGGYVTFGGNPKGGKITCRARTPQQNGVAERNNRTLIEAARTMLADSKLPTTFWTEKTSFKLYVIDHLGKFNGKADEGFFVRYSINSKAFRVFNSKTRIVEENLHVQFIVTGNQSNGNAGTKAYDDADSKSSPDARSKPLNDGEKKVDGDPSKEDESNDQEMDDNVNSTNNVNTASDGNNTNNVNVVSSTINVASIKVNDVGAKSSIELPDDPNMPESENIVYSDDDDEGVGAEADMNNLDTFMPVSPIPTTRVHKDHTVEQIIRDLNLAPQTRRMTKNLEEHEEPKKTLVDLPNGKRSIGTKWVYRNKKDERGIVIKNKARFFAQGYTQEEGIDNDEVFDPVARIEAIMLFLAYALFKDFVVYQMDVKSDFLYFKIKEEVYVCQLPGFEDPDFPDRVYKVEKALYRLHQAPRAWGKGDILLVQVYVDDIIFGSTKKSLCTEFKKMMHKKFQISFMGELTFFLGLQVKHKEYGIFISQDKYVTEILNKFGFSDVKTASTPMETQNPLLKDEDGKEVDVHLYRSMIGLLMCLTSSRPDIMFAVCACTRYQVNPKVSHFHAVKRIFRYLKGQPKLGLWYPKNLPFDLVAYTDSDYARASLDRKFTIGGCQFLRCRLISWQCKKQTVVANSTTEDEYVDASSCCGQVLWIQNELLDYGYNFMHTKIYIDNESTICIVKNPVFHLKTKHIEIRHHFIRDSNEKKLIQMISIHTDKNVADLLTKAFD
ncbi:putative ribonuclease H-like domain-containing protein, partial [Tanacetum coccineum]